MFCPAKPEKALRSGMSYLSSVRITDLSAADMKMLLSALILVPALSRSSCSSFSQKSPPLLYLIRATPLKKSAKVMRSSASLPAPPLLTDMVNTPARSTTLTRLSSTGQKVFMMVNRLAEPVLLVHCAKTSSIWPAISALLADMICLLRCSLRAYASCDGY
jgi:hypothetical protein